MAKFRVYGIVTGTKYLGVYEAATKEEAEGKALESPRAYVSICWHCAKEIDDPEIMEVRCALCDDDPEIDDGSEDH